MYLILTQNHRHIFNFAHRIRRKINTLKEEGTIFETNMKLCNIREDQDLTGSSQS